jgi:hypothetical protein
MPVEVDSSPRHSLLASIVGTSLTGDGLLVRLRSTMIALLGLVAAVGLGLVAVVSQIGWPSVVSGPIPNPPAPAVVRNDAIVAPPAPRVGLRPARARATGADRLPVDAGATEAPKQGLAALHQAEPPPAAPNPPAAPSPPQAQPPPSTDEPAPTQVRPVNARPPTAEPPSESSPPTATISDSPGKSGESHGGGPPSWAPAGGGGHGQAGEHGRPDWAGH